jgi:hypothetical protein
MGQKSTMEVKIFLFTFNRPDILELQIKCLFKYIKNDFKIVVIHDSRDDTYQQKFIKICENYQIKYYNHTSFPGKSPSNYHAESIQWAYDNVVKTECVDNIVVFLDHDMFLICDFDLVKLMKNYDIVGPLQIRESIKYIWPGLFIFKESSLRNLNFDFNPQYVEGIGVDTGGGTYKLLRNSNLKYKDAKVEYPEEYNDINLVDQLVTKGFNSELYLDNIFFHFRNASNWHNNFDVQDSEKTDIMLKIINSIIS